MNRTVAAAPSIPQLRVSRMLRDGALPGAVAGILGGIAFGASMIELGDLESIASLVRADTPVVGGLVHMSVAAVVGAVFGMLVFQQRATAADTLIWGTAYGAFFWFVGPLTLRPLILGEAVLWDIRTAHAFFASLIGHVVWGAAAGLSLAALRAAVRPWRAAVGANSRLAAPLGLRGRIRMAGIGGLAGVTSAVILTALLPNHNELTAPVAGAASTNWLAVLAVGAVVGAFYGALVPYSKSLESARLGVRLVQGITVGYLSWIVVAITIVPLEQTDTLAWTARLARDRFEVFPGYLLFGTLLAFLFCVISGGARFLFSDELRQYDRLTAGPQRLRAAFRGVLAGIVGGLLFTIVIVQIGALGRVSRLVGAKSPVVGFVVHIVIAVLIGVTYALLFRRQSFDVRSGVGWGVAYGLLWWVLGALTLLPVLLGGTPQWNAAAAARAFPSLVGHLAYGMGLGAAFYLLEARYNPWWITRSETEAERTRARREQVLTSAPALWAFVVFVALFVAIVLARAPA